MSLAWLYLALAGAGVAAGFLNTVAGGGSLLTLPALMLLGLPADVANGTNRLAIVSQSVSGMAGFRRRGKLETRAITPVLVPTVAGALLGAATATHVPAAILKHVLLTTMLLMAVLMAATPRMVFAPDGEEPRPAFRPASMLGLFGAGLYGGFIQAGVGVLLLAVLGGLLRHDLVRANALKVTCVAVFSLVALAVFVIAGQVAWLPGCALALASAAGSQLGVRFALRISPQVLRWIVVACVVAMCAGVVLKG